MKLLFVALIGTLASGCFFVGDINQRPAIDIATDSDAVSRGEPVQLRAVSQDPEGQGVDFDWRVYLCTDAADFATCDQDPKFTGIEPTLGFIVPIQRDNGEPVQSMLAKLRGTDDHGASSLADDQLIIPVGDAKPRLALREDSKYGHVVGTPLALYASYGDSDDVPTDLIVGWEVFAPATSTEVPVDDGADVDDPGMPGNLLDSRSIVPDALGTWIFRVTTTDPLGEATVEDLEVQIMPDHAPCLAQWSPSAPTGGATLPVSEPTLFQIPIVSDDLDPYPSIPSDDIYGTATFRWSLKVGTGARRPLDATANSVAVDPASYPPGTELELRVEIADRQQTQIECADADQTCSVISEPTCLQRQTWHVEVR